MSRKPVSMKNIQDGKVTYEELKVGLRKVGSQLAEPERKMLMEVVLWALQDLDKKWLLLQKQKSALQSYYNKRFEEESCRVYDETRLNLNRQLFESVMRSLKEAGSEREVDDVDSKLALSVRQVFRRLLAGLDVVLSNLDYV